MIKSEQGVNHLLFTIPDYIQKVYCDTNKSTQPFKCAVISCSNTFSNLDKNKILPYKFHKFPANKKIRKLWKLKCGWNKYEHVKNQMVCSEHFKLDDYIRNYREEFQNPKFKRLLNPNAVPNLKLGPQQDVSFDVSDGDYNTDDEYSQDVPYNLKHSLHQNGHFSTKQPSQKHPNDSHNLGPLDLNEVIHEVDLNVELERINTELQSELKKCDATLVSLTKQTRYLKMKAQQFKNNNKIENKTLRKIFSKSQLNVLTGKKAVWSDDDLARAFTIRHMGSKKCYLYLKNTLKMPLPALSCVQKWAATRAQDI